MERKEVYHLIDGERDYQDNLGPDRKEVKELPHSVGDYTTMMTHYQAELIRVWTLNAGDRQSLEVMRKIAGIAVHCMEDHGAPGRGPRPANPKRTGVLPHPLSEEGLRRVASREEISFPDGIELGPYSLGKGSLKNLKGVHPDLVWIVHYAIKITEQDFTVTDGVRTRWHQADNVRAGVSQTMKSKHMIQSDGWGHAVDLVPWIDGRAKWDLPACYNIMEAMRRASFARGCLLRWGGAWVPLSDRSPLQTPEKLVQAYTERKRAKGKPAFIDGPHYEMV